MSNDEERTVLARQRTIMAAERTLLSYYRTSLAVIGVATFIYKFYDSKFSLGISAVFVTFGIALAVMGTIKNRSFNRKLKN